MKFLIIILSLLLSLGLFADKYFPLVKEFITGIILVKVLINRRNLSSLIVNLNDLLPLILIFLIFSILGAILPYYLQGESVVNTKFLLAIFFFGSLSVVFKNNPEYIQVSLISFGIGAGILSILFGIGFFGAEAYEIRNDRLDLLGENPNSLSVRVSLGLLFLVWGCVENGLKISLFKRILLIIPIPFMFNLILLSGSRGSFLLCVGSVALYILLLKNVSKVLKNLIIIVGVIMGLITVSLFFQSALYERFISTGLIDSRAEIWESAIEIFKRNPLGVGEIGYKFEIFQKLGVMIDTHNVFIYLLVSGGFISLILFLIFLFRLFIKSYRHFRVKSNIIYLIIYFSMIFVMSKTGGVLSYLIMWYFFACLNGLSLNYKVNAQNNSNNSIII